MDVKKMIDEIFSEILIIRRHLHAYPECSEQEVMTEEFISKKLTELGIAHEKNIAGHGIVGILEGKKPSLDKEKICVAIRADIDALPIQECTELSYASQIPNVMHACGHDMHTAIALGSAMILKKMEEEFSGTVKFFFQPAEETVGGAKQMIDAGCMENPKVDRVIALHIQPELPTGTLLFFREAMNASSTEFEILVEGISCHGAHPDQGVDPIFLASSIVTALQAVSSRNLAPTTPGIVTVGKIHGGTAKNIIPKEVELAGVIRAMDLDTREFIKNRVEQIATNTALAHGGTAKVKFLDSYPPLNNTPEVVEVLERVAKEYLPADQIRIGLTPSLGADDFAYFSQAVPCAYFDLGTKRPEEKTPQNLHSELLNPDEESMKVGVFMEVMGVLELLKGKELFDV